jgi:hypothetical protein
MASSSPLVDGFLADHSVATSVYGFCVKIAGLRRMVYRAIGLFLAFLTVV